MHGIVAADETCNVQTAGFNGMGMMYALREIYYAGPALT